MIIGRNGAWLTYYGDRFPTREWSSFAVPLDARAFRVSEAAFQRVMRNVEAVLIRGEYRGMGGFERSGLDNVRLDEAPLPLAGDVHGLRDGLALRDGDELAVRLRGLATGSWINGTTPAMPGYVYACENSATGDRYEEPRRVIGRWSCDPFNLEAAEGDEVVVHLRGFVAR